MCLLAVPSDPDDWLQLLAQVARGHHGEPCKYKSHLRAKELRWYSRLLLRFFDPAYICIFFLGCFTTGKGYASIGCLAQVKQRSTSLFRNIDHFEEVHFAVDL